VDALKILLYASIALQAVFSPLFLKYMWPRKTWKSLTFKMLCSVLFVATAFLSVKIADNHTLYAETVVIGLLCGFVGDLFLGLNGKANFVIGTLFFLTNHILYCYAYTMTRNSLFPESKSVKMTVVEIVAAFLVLAVFIFIVKRLKFSLRGAASLLLLYGLVLSYMLVKSVTFGAALLSSGNAAYSVGAGLLLSGAALYFVSDMSLGMILLGGVKNYPLKCFNNLTYIFGQVCIALTLLYIA
jgi:uncharacterized membrane protein YhhN